MLLAPLKIASPIYYQKFKLVYKKSSVLSSEMVILRGLQKIFSVNLIVTLRTNLPKE